MKPENPSSPASPDRLDASPYSADLPELQQARAFWVAHRLNESLRHYDRAVRLYPDHPVALMEAAVAFGHRFEIGRAEELLSRLLTATSELRFLMAAGNCYQSIGRLEEAIDCFAAAVAASPDHFDAHLKLSQLYERLNQLETGLAHAQHCLSVEPESPEAILMHGQLLRRMGELNQAEFRLKQLSGDPNIPTAIRVSSGYQLGYLLDNA
jgi:tetratricopeptide (TPR) repeat protein